MVPTHHFHSAWPLMFWALQEKVVVSPASKDGGELIVTFEAGSAKFFVSNMFESFTRLKFHDVMDIYICETHKQCTGGASSLQEESPRCYLPWKMLFFILLLSLTIIVKEKA